MRQIPASICAHTARQMPEETQYLLHLEALKRLLDRQEPHWRG